MRKKFLKQILFTAMVSGLLVHCEKVHKHAGRPASPSGKETPLPDPNEKIPTQTCEQQWGEFSELQPQGRQTSYQETQSAQIKGELIVLSQSVISKQILENTADKISWKKQTDILAPETGHTEALISMTKIKFIELCGKGINLTYSDRPSGYKPYSLKTETLKFKDEDFEVSHEKYLFSKSTRPTDRDEMELWIGAKAPYKGLLFKMQRKFMKTSPVLSENTVEKTLQDYSDQ